MNLWCKDTTVCAITVSYTHLGLILQFAFTYTDDNRPKLNNFKEMMEIADYLDSQDMVEKFVRYDDKHGLKRRNLLIKKSHKLLDRVIDSLSLIHILFSPVRPKARRRS